MKANKQPIIFSHKDLDGVVSYLVLCWTVDRKLQYVATTPMNLSKDWDNWSRNNNIENYQIYFLDLDVSKIGEQIDLDNVCIFDHHKTNLYHFKNAKTFISQETSCAKLLYNHLFKKTQQPLAENRKALIMLADDWDCQSNKSSLSEDLNIVYHQMQNKFQSFIEDYWEGFVPFDKFKANTIALYKKHCKEYLKQLKVFTGDLEFEGVLTNVGAIFCEKYVHECCNFLFEKYNVDVSIAVILNQKRIAVRRNKSNSKVDVSKFVQRIASGGGHEMAAGGNLTEDFIEFTKMLKPV